MTASGPDRYGTGRGHREPGFLARLASWSITLVVVIVTVAFSVFLVAAATGHLDTVRSLVGL